MKWILLSTVALSALLAGSQAAKSVEHNDFLGFKSQPRIALGGLGCAACTVLTGLVDQLALVHRESHDKSFDRLCDLFPSPYSTACSAFKLIYGYDIKDFLKKGQTPDVICIGNGFCPKPAAGKGMCHLFPTKNKLDQKSPVEINRIIDELMITAGVNATLTSSRMDSRIDFCAIPLIGSLICNFLNLEAFGIKHPDDDDDKDWFSDSFALRGSAWRGKDCKDNSGSTYPGRRPENGDLTHDSNCNGITGRGLTGPSMEQELCDFTGARGVIALGDSVTANFHIPGLWFDATVTNSGLFKELPGLMDNTFNWPHTSFFTGYRNVISPILDGATDSIYLRMRARNLCNHRDFQNIGFNGARMTDAAFNAQTIKRSHQDKPAVAFFSYLGNDVCKYDAENDGTTTVGEARAGLLATMAILNQKLQAGSYAVVVGVADARPFFDSLRTKIHPFGAARKDVTYLNFYDWLECLDINPCRGWLTNDEGIRELTAKRVAAINVELKRTVESSQSSFPNVKMVYLDNPIDELLRQWATTGGESWELVETFDGFHPNQKAHKLIAEVLWNQLEKNHPEVLGPVNPKNNLIRALFDEQGGH